MLWATEDTFSRCLDKLLERIRKPVSPCTAESGPTRCGPVWSELVGIEAERAGTLGVGEEFVKFLSC